MKKSNKFSPEVRERAVRMVQEHRGEYPSPWAAIESIAPKIGCVPQRGSQHLSIRYCERLTEAGVESSVCSKGDSYDNAQAETINGLYKAELIHRRAPWKTKDAIELATLDWVAWFKNHRRLEPIG